MPSYSGLAAELAPGYVVHLCPKRLNGLGAKVSGDPDRWVKDPHSFLIVEGGAKRCRLLPLFSLPGPGRVEISTIGRTGHEFWTQGTYHYHAGQVWEASRQAIERAAVDGNDFSTPGARNLLEPQYIPNV